MARFRIVDRMAGSVRHLFAVVWAVPLVLGCAFYDEALLPSLTGEFGGSLHAAPLSDLPMIGMDELTPYAAPIFLPVAGDGITAGPLQPLAVIRFAKPDLVFEDELRAAIQHALAGKPDAGFGLVAVSPSSTGATLDAVSAQRNIERVLAAMTKAGVTQDRVLFSAASDKFATSDEVRVYLLDLVKAP